MKHIKIQDKTFRTYIEEKVLLEQIKATAQRINTDFKGQKPVFLCTLKGAFMFLADLLKEIDLDCEVSFTRLSSYDGTQTTGKVKPIIGINDNLKGRRVIIIEDIVENGFTIKKLYEELPKHQPESIDVCTMFFKPKAYKLDFDIKYHVVSIDNEFIVGHGLDYNELGRNLKDIYIIEE